jgi:hypothetical protein
VTDQCLRSDAGSAQGSNRLATREHSDTDPAATDWPTDPAA